MGNRQIGFVPHDHWQQTDSSGTRSQYLEYAMLPPVAADHFTSEIVEVQEFAHLVRVSCRDQYLIPSLIKFFHDRKKEWNMRGVI